MRTVIPRSVRDINNFGRTDRGSTFRARDVLTMEEYLAEDDERRS
jgi:hypothetical protein